MLENKITVQNILLFWDWVYDYYHIQFITLMSISRVFIIFTYKFVYFDFLFKMNMFLQSFFFSFLFLCISYLLTIIKSNVTVTCVKCFCCLLFSHLNNDFSLENRSLMTSIRCLNFLKVCFRMKLLHSLRHPKNCTSFMNDL